MKKRETMDLPRKHREKPITVELIIDHSIKLGIGQRRWDVQSAF